MAKVRMREMNGGNARRRRKKHDDLKVWLDYESGVTPEVGKQSLHAWLG